MSNSGRKYSPGGLDNPTIITTTSDNSHPYPAETFQGDNYSPDKPDSISDYPPETFEDNDVRANDVRPNDVRPNDVTPDYQASSDVAQEEVTGSSQDIDSRDLPTTTNYYQMEY